MTISDETLMAYADGEADAAKIAAVEAAMREDPGVRARIAQHRALRSTLQGAFATVLDDAVPQRLIDAARGIASPGGKVVDIAKARSAASIDVRRASRWQPVAMAASLLLGAALGFWGWHGSDALVKTGASGALVANAGLADALSNQLAADRRSAQQVITGLSFRAKSGEYCRTFSIAGKAASSGVACRQGGDWQIKVLAQASQAAPQNGEYRQAASADTPAVRSAVEQYIDGEPLDAAGELAARRAGWATAATDAQR
jgi:hypothetical protein